MSVPGRAEAATSIETAPAFMNLRDCSPIDVRRARAFWRHVERFSTGAIVAHLPDATSRNIVVVSGWVCEFRILRDGRRQIFSFLLPGDAIAIAPGPRMGQRGLLAVTNVEIADASLLAADSEVEPNSAGILEAIRQHEERLFDHMVRIGRLTAKERVLNLLLELYDRLDAIGLVKESTFRLPLTQEMFADALGLSVVHINRTLQQLRQEGMITIRRGAVTLHQPQKLASVASYQANEPTAKFAGEHLVA